MDAHTGESAPSVEVVQILSDPNAASIPPEACSDAFTDDDVLPAFEANFDLPQNASRSG